MDRDVMVELRDDERTLREASTDYGRIVRRTPRVVVRPRTADEVAQVAEQAGRAGQAVSVQRMAHTQGGQSLTDRACQPVTRRAPSGILHEDQRCRGLVHLLEALIARAGRVANGTERPYLFQRNRPLLERQRACGSRVW